MYVGSVFFRSSDANVNSPSTSATVSTDDAIREAPRFGISTRSMIVEVPAPRLRAASFSVLAEIACRPASSARYVNGIAVRAWNGPRLSGLDRNQGAKLRNVAAMPTTNAIGGITQGSIVIIVSVPL